MPSFPANPSRLPSPIPASAAPNSANTMGITTPSNPIPSDSSPAAGQGIRGNVQNAPSSRSGRGTFFHRIVAPDPSESTPSGSSGRTAGYDVGGARVIVPEEAENSAEKNKAEEQAFAEFQSTMMEIASTPENEGNSESITHAKNLLALLDKFSTKRDELPPNTDHRQQLRPIFFEMDAALMEAEEAGVIRADTYSKVLTHLAKICANGRNLSSNEPAPWENQPAPLPNQPAPSAGGRQHSTLSPAHRFMAMPLEHGTPVEGSNDQLREFMVSPGLGLPPVRIWRGSDGNGQ